MESDPHRAAELAARESYGRLLAFLSARSRDVAAAEDALSDAFRNALETWPRIGVPRGAPGGFPGGAPDDVSGGVCEGTNKCAESGVWYIAAGPWRRCFPPCTAEWQPSISSRLTGRQFLPGTIRRISCCFRAIV